MLTDKQILDAYGKYAKSHWTPPEDSNGTTGLLGPQLWSLTPMQHSLESFSEKCNTDKNFYEKYKL